LAQVQRADAAALDTVGYPLGRDARRDALDDGGLADTRMTDQHRVVLGAPPQNLQCPANFRLTADYRVELALRRPHHQIDGVVVQRRHRRRP